LFLAAFLLLGYQIAQEWQFKWSDNNQDSICCYAFAFMRCTLNSLAVLLPVWFLGDLENVDEVYLRMIFAGIMGILQPIGLFFIFPEYFVEIKKFFSKYSQNTKRNWQSAGKSTFEK
jgi:carbon starvation protein CstA